MSMSMANKHEKRRGVLTCTANTRNEGNNLVKNPGKKEPLGRSAYLSRIFKKQNTKVGIGCTGQARKRRQWRIFVLNFRVHNGQATDSKDEIPLASQEGPLFHEVGCLTHLPSKWNVRGGWGVK